MIKALLLLTTTFVFTLDAQAQRRDIDQRLSRASRTLSAAIEDNKRYMTFDEKRQILELLREGIAIARGDYDRGNPIAVSLTVGNNGYVIESRGTLTSTLDACKKRLGDREKSSTYKMSATVGGETVSMTNSSYWRSAEDKCQALVFLAEKAARQANTTLSHKSHVIYGFAGNHGLLAEGNSLGELRNSCLDMTKIYGQSIYKISAQLNGGEARSRTNSSYWRTSDVVCETAISLVY